MSKNTGRRDDTPQQQIAALLGTNDHAQQLAIIQQLAGAPAVAVTILYDTRQNRVTGLSSTMRIEVADMIGILADAQRMVGTQMAKAAMQQQPPPDGEPPSATPPVADSNVASDMANLEPIPEPA